MSLLNRRYGPNSKQFKAEYGHDHKPCLDGCTVPRGQVFNQKQVDEIHAASMPAPHRRLGSRAQTHIEIKQPRQMSRVEHGIAGMAGIIEDVTGGTVNGNLVIGMDGIDFTFDKRHRTDAVTIQNATGMKCEILTSKSLRVYR